MILRICEKEEHEILGIYLSWFHYEKKTIIRMQKSLQDRTPDVTWSWNSQRSLSKLWLLIVNESSKMSPEVTKPKLKKIKKKKKLSCN